MVGEDSGGKSSAVITTSTAAASAAAAVLVVFSPLQPLVAPAVAAAVLVVFSPVAAAVAADDSVTDNDKFVSADISGVSITSEDVNNGPIRESDVAVRWPIIGSETVDC